MLSSVTTFKQESNKAQFLIIFQFLKFLYVFKDTSYSTHDYKLLLDTQCIRAGLDVPIYMNVSLNYHFQKTFHRYMARTNQHTIVFM